MYMYTSEKYIHESRENSWTESWWKTME